MKNNGKNKNMGAVDFPSLEYSEICSTYLKQNIILLDVVFNLCTGEIRFLHFTQIDKMSISVNCDKYIHTYNICIE